MPLEVVVYTTRTCAYCLRAKALLARRGIPYRVVDVTGDDERRAWLAHRTGRWKVPQIFIGDDAIGGFAELVELDRTGALEARVAGASPTG